MELSILRILAGILLLFLGRRLFWLFVGLLGFLAGMTFGAQVFSGQPDWVLFVVAIVCGLIGIFLALFLQRLAIAIAGFLAGALFLSMFVAFLGLSIPPLISYMIGGVLGAVLISVLFDWALILLSSVTGAVLIAQSLSLEPLIGLLVFVVLVIVGITVQSRRPAAVPQSQR